MNKTKICKLKYFINENKKEKHFNSIYCPKFQFQRRNFGNESSGK